MEKLNNADVEGVVAWTQGSQQYKLEAPASGSTSRLRKLTRLRFELVLQRLAMLKIEL
jgi:hypothetical protein